MSRSLELGRAVLSSPTTNLELWLTTSIIISSTQDQSDWQTFKSADLLNIISSGAFWVSRASGLHALLHLDMRDEPFPLAQLQDLANLLLQAPVWKQLLLQPSLPENAFKELGIVRLDIRYMDDGEAQEEVLHRRVYSQSSVRDLKPPDSIETILFDSVYFSMQLLKPRPSGRTNIKPLEKEDEDVEMVEKNLHVTDTNLFGEINLSLDDSNIFSHDTRHAFQPNSTTTQSMERKRKRQNSSSQGPLDQERRYQKQMITLQPNQATIPSPSVLSDLENLIDGSLRLSVCGNLHAKSCYGLRVKANTFHQGLADIAPSLWKPGYLLALTQRSSLIDTVSRSIYQMAYVKAFSPSLRHKAQTLTVLARERLKKNSYDLKLSSSHIISEPKSFMTASLWRQLERHSADTSVSLLPFIPREGQVTSDSHLDDMLEETAQPEGNVSMVINTEMNDDTSNPKHKQCMLYSDFASVLALETESSKQMCLEFMNSKIETGTNGTFGYPMLLQA